MNTSQETPVKPRADLKIELQLRCQFTDKELLELGKKMAEAAGLLEQEKDEAKAVAAQLKAKCDATAARLTEASTKITNGYEYRQVRCVVKYDTPKTGQKTTVRTDSNDIVEVAEMSLAEMQLPLSLEEKPKVTPGTVELPEDEGSRDDAGEHSKNT